MTELRRSDRALIIIGGHEDKEGDKLILRAVAERVGSGKLVVATVASEMPETLWEEYEHIFRSLGVKHVYKLSVATREEAMSDGSLRVLDDATGVFFTGGDQVKITSQLGCSKVCERIQEIYESGGTIAGTSAGASVMSETMMVAGTGSETHRIGGALRLAPGLGLIRGIIVDQHFAERGRIGRLLGAVAQNPRILGIGIDENTAVIVERDRKFTVVGEGGVCILDAGSSTYTNLTDEETDRALSAFDIKLHMLSQGDIFDCQTRRPKARAAEVVEEELLGSR
ncbi:MAG TPA: cyanophycinase [Gemmatimonadaceae bacterium]|nr:cyanophycinase [Gemmatimonadaceae bacterium]